MGEQVRAGGDLGSAGVLRGWGGGGAPRNNYQAAWNQALRVESGRISASDSSQKAARDAVYGLEEDSRRGRLRGGVEGQKLSLVPRHEESVIHGVEG